MAGREERCILDIAGIQSVIVVTESIHQLANGGYTRFAFLVMALGPLSISLLIIAKLNPTTLSSVHIESTCFGEYCTKIAFLTMALGLAVEHLPYVEPFLHLAAL